MASDITRRRFLGTLSAAALTAAGTPLALGHSTVRRPNIVFVYTDDQGPWTLGASGNADAFTPNIDRFFASSAYLRNNFVTTPVCSPARASLMTSRYGTEVGITDWLHSGTGRLVDESNIGLDPSFGTWPMQLAEAGYRNILVGKWHLGVADRYHPTKLGFQEFTGFRSGGTKVADPELEVEGESKQHTGLTVDIFTDYTVEALKRAQHDQPFALCLHHRSPHAPWPPFAPEDSAPYEGRDLTIPNPDFPDLDTERVRDSMQKYLSSVSGVDRGFARVLETLETCGLRDNTIVVFTSDNGYNVGHHGIIHKGNGQWITNAARGKSGADGSITRPNMFDNSLRVPTAIRWPGVTQAGSIIDATTTILDWYPTMMEAAGVEPRGLRRGRSMTPLLRGESVPWNDDLYAEYSMHHYTEADLRMYRTRDWKLVRDFKREGKDELYNLSTDSDETANLISDSGSQRVRSDLNEMLLACMRQTSDPVLSRT